MILQTSLTPQFFPPAFEGNFGWAFGVQWIYLTVMLWYESVYAVVLPIYLTEMLFPRRRCATWLSDRGLAIIEGIFVLASIGVWQLWNRVRLQRYGPSIFQAPLPGVIPALVVIARLIAGTLTLGQRGHTTEKGTWGTPHPWLVWVMSVGFSAAWFFLIILAYVPAATFDGLSSLIPIGIGLVGAALALVVVQSMSSSVNWNDRHRLALIFRASVASMLGVPSCSSLSDRSTSSARSSSI